MIENSFKQFANDSKSEEYQAIIKSIDSKKAKKWAMNLDTELLTYLKNIGDGAIHPNDGDITKQSELDNELLVQIQKAFRVLLYLVYEVPHEKQARMGMFQAKAQEFKK